MAAASVLAASKPFVQGALTALPGVAKVAGGVLGGPVGGALGGLAGQFIAGRLDPAMKAQRAQQAKDIAALQGGKLGLSETEKRTMLAGAARGIQAQTAGIESNLRRQAAAQGGFGRSGAQTKALGNLAATRGEQVAQYAGKVDDLSQQTAERRKAEIMNRLELRRQEALKAGSEAGQALTQLPAAIGVAKKKVDMATKADQGDESAQLTAAMDAATKRLAELKGAN
jgi:hypothetical protein